MHVENVPHFILNLTISRFSEEGSIWKFFTMPSGLTVENEITPDRSISATLTCKTFP